ncbi:branched-chain amino acid ABC transporter permease [Pinisolibacter aquiterrae]|uniref:branched-chain amino acid ABC transporter permease n=1 Tax=Pinisolibacter aquiterrae TaxID=2815579 RepID=UPI001C3DECAD|nr:branched-chain amino acid ABC transporter permease [Pinisolibacter aquiterrae]MBV5264616.1 branched-chain amino acid ABC transporter permease [Pinisolibacter aquiterrae]MCC8233385.1 branched-chain amino acid ABC transporter permease [Pinisolibacter aquiterrae]
MTVVFDGIASGMLLFLIAVGLSVTLGLMNFVNLAHGAFAMFGGYVCVVASGRWGIPFLPAVVLAALATAALGALLERLLFRRLYGASQLDQVLFSIGLVFVAMAIARWGFGPAQQPIRLPAWLQGQVHLGGLDIGVYRAFLVGLGLAVAYGLHRAIGVTRFGARLRASVDKPDVARGMGIDVDRVFVVTFALGSGLAGLGGAVGVELLGLDPSFPLRYLVYFLIVVAVGGSGSIPGSLIAAILIGVCDVAGKYWMPQIGAFIIYTVMVVMLIVRPHGLLGRK